MSQSAGAMRSSRTSSRRHHYQLLAPKPTQPEEVQCGIYLEGRVGRPQHRSRPTPPPPGRSALVMSWTFLGSRYGPGAQGTVVNPQRERAPDQSILEDPDLIISCPWSIDGPSYIAHPISPDPISFDLTHDLAPLSPWNACRPQTSSLPSGKVTRKKPPKECPHCGAMMTHLSRHIAALHSPRSPLPCPHPGCGLSFPRKDALARHLRSSHSSSSSKESRLRQGGMDQWA
ncbi:MAG: hypothetical protein DHS80DRAFT_33741 [Piptocephalis tieghemiana]|nr:MAG: hypothetical protein DHS80DRAFT_33741 [Piptocephalis tieghemiana]